MPLLFLAVPLMIKIRLMKTEGKIVHLLFLGGSYFLDYCLLQVEECTLPCPEAADLFCIRRRMDTLACSLVARVCEAFFLCCTQLTLSIVNCTVYSTQRYKKNKKMDKGSDWLSGKQPEQWFLQLASIPCHLADIGAARYFLVRKLSTWSVS